MEDHKSKIIDDASGQDLDVWGGVDTRPNYVPRPGTADPCILKVAGSCPAACDLCLQFAGEAAQNAQL
jgi:hypothetical protein